jgi:hypothetical protein
MMPPIVAKTSKYHGTFKASVTIVDTVSRRPIARVTGHGNSLDVLDRVHAMCVKTATKRYACDDPVLYFVRYGRRECIDETLEWSFLDDDDENNIDA